MQIGLCEFSRVLGSPNWSRLSEWFQVGLNRSRKSLKLVLTSQNKSIKAVISTKSSKKVQTSLKQQTKMTKLIWRLVMKHYLSTHKSILGTVTWEFHGFSWNSSKHPEEARKPKGLEPQPNPKIFFSSNSFIYYQHQ